VAGKKAPKRQASKAGAHLPAAHPDLVRRADRALAELRDALWVAQRIARGEGSDSPSARRVVLALERAASVLRLDGEKTLPNLRVRRATRILDNARRHLAEGAKPRALARILARQENANGERRADALSSVPVEAWAQAIRDWQGQTESKRGNPRGGYVWSKIIWELLRAGGLTHATNARNLRDAFLRADIGEI
jgi:hypothetical protein